MRCRKKGQNDPICFQFYGAQNNTSCPLPYLFLHTSSQLADRKLIQFSLIYSKDTFGCFMVKNTNSVVMESKGAHALKSVKKSTSEWPSVDSLIKKLAIALLWQCYSTKNKASIFDFCNKHSQTMTTFNNHLFWGFVVVVFLCVFFAQVLDNKIATFFNSWYLVLFFQH